MRIALLAVLCAAAPADLLTPEESKGIEAVVASMVAAGFPDAAKATVHFGKLSVSATFDPAKEPPPLPSDASGTQMTVPGSTRMTYGYAFEGLHFKLADGSWIISLSYRFRPKAGDTVDASNATAVDLAALTETAAKAHPFNAEKDAAKYLEGIAPAHRARAGPRRRRSRSDGRCSGGAARRSWRMIRSSRRRRPPRRARRPSIPKIARAMPRASTRSSPGRASP